MDSQSEDRSNLKMRTSESHQHMVLGKNCMDR